MSKPSLRQAEHFHVALNAACEQCGLVTRYLGALAHNTRPGLKDFYELAVWSVELVDAEEEALKPRPAPKVLCCFELVPTKRAGAFVLHIPRGLLNVRPFAVLGGGTWIAALRRHGVNEKLFRNVLHSWASRR